MNERLILKVGGVLMCMFWVGRHTAYSARQADHAAEVRQNELTVSETKRQREHERKLSMLALGRHAPHGIFTWRLLCFFILRECRDGGTSESAAPCAMPKAFECAAK